MELDQLLHQGQADARALVRAAPRVLDPVEPLEDIAGISSAGMPVPVSRTASSTAARREAQ